MRTYSGFLILEDILDFLPGDNSIITNFSYEVTNPLVNVVTADCATIIGTLIDVNYEIEGNVELSTGLTITKTRIDTLLTAGNYTVKVRDLHSCTAPNGICQKCYAGTFIDLAIPAVGASLRVPPSFNYQSDVFTGNGFTSIYTMTEAPTNYDKVLIIKNGIIQTTGFTTSGTTFTASVNVPLNENYVARYYKTTAQPFMGYISETYSGSLLGMQPLPTSPLHLPHYLFENSISDQKIDLVSDQLIQNYKAITSIYSRYIGKIQDKLEKALYIIILYGIYGNVRY